MVKTSTPVDSMQDCKFVKLVSKGTQIVIRPTNGLRTIAKSDNIFGDRTDSDFVKYKTNIGGKPTGKMEVQIFEQTHDGKLPQLFGDFDKNLDHLCMSQDQIISFVESHDKWLSRNGWGTLFLFKVRSWHLVAAVNRTSAGLHVYMFRLFNGGHTFRAKDKHHIIVPLL